MSNEPMASTVAAMDLLMKWDSMSKEQEQDFASKTYLAELTTRFPEPLPQLTCYVRLQLKHLALFTHDFTGADEKDLERVHHVIHTLIKILSHALMQDMLSEARGSEDEATKSPLYQLMLALKAVKHEQFPHIEDKIDAFLVPSYSIEDKENTLCEILQDKKFHPVFGILGLKNDDDVAPEFDLTQVIHAEHIDSLVNDFGIDTSPVTNQGIAKLVKQLVQFNMTKEVLLQSATVPVTDEYVNNAIESMCAYFEQTSPEKWAAMAGDDGARSADMRAFIERFKAKKDLSRRESEKKQKQRERELKKRATNKRKKK